MELLQLRYFLVAAKYQHITKAAETLQIAQPALSQSIKRLETELGVSLFERKKRSIQLNETGKFLEKQLTPILAALDELPSMVQEQASKDNHTIHLNILAATRLVTDCMIRYKELHPEVQFRLSQNPDIEKEDICVLTSFPEEVPETDSRLILEEPFYLAVPSSSAYLSKKMISLAEVKDEGFISLSNSRPFRRICDRFCLQSGFTPRTICETDNPESLRNLIAADLGIGFWPEYSWGPVNHPKVTLLPIESPQCRRAIFLSIRRKGGNAELIDDFCDFLISYAKK